METKLTAVQWLLENLNFEPYDEEEFISNAKMWEQAEAMEKEQITKSYDNGALMSYTLTFKEPFVKGEQYYNETYGK